MKVTLVLSDEPRAECDRCHATWIPAGASQRDVRKPPAGRKPEERDGT